MFLERWEKNSVAFSLQTNNTDRATAVYRWSYFQLLRIEDVAWSLQNILMAVNLGFLDWNCYYFFQITLQLSSRDWVVTVADLLLLKKCGRNGIEPGTSGSVASNPYHQTTEAFLGGNSIVVYSVEYLQTSECVNGISRKQAKQY
jgi:hypothetical protein